MDDGRLLYVPYFFDGGFSTFTIGENGVALEKIHPLNGYLSIVDVNMGQAYICTQMRKISFLRSLATTTPRAMLR